MGYILAHNLSLWINLKPIQKLIVVVPLILKILYNLMFYSIRWKSYVFISLMLKSISSIRILIFTWYLYEITFESNFILEFPLQILIIKSWYIDFTNTTINQCIWIYIKRRIIFRCVFLQNKIPCVKYFNLTLFFRLIDDLLNDSKSACTSSQIL